MHSEEPQYAVDTRPGQWVEDELGPGFSYTTIARGRDEEGPLSATLVRYLPVEASSPEPPREQKHWRDAMLNLRQGLDRVLAGGPQAGAATEEPTDVVLGMHGWTDYFYNAELARYWAGRGYRFYALDLRRYGRSLRSWQTPGFVTSLTEYDVDIEAALATIREDVGPVGRTLCVAHSTGGLTASLYAHRHPGVFTALILNSPWLEMQGSWLVRNAAAGLLDPLARVRPKARIKLPEVDHYWQSLSNRAHGEWDIHPLWRPRHAFPVTAGWITAVLAGHAEVNRGLDIKAPVLVMTSDRTHLGTSFEPEMLVSDTVIEVETVRQRALKLGHEVAIVRIEAGMHDLFTSAARTRAKAYEAVTRFCDGYVPAP
ncbi:MAG: alpha/beta hydrolase [Arthrobacter sp.]|uniref:alpha/beta hydrolase n=1 Tax=unclassified Arthrobacter TaxID=235627 RepID=UPI00264AFC26|nr:alpha/beta hydrolase [Micrococcaceae bacterium]MDN5812238.1 alpha/beta hydrolase [Micrococcaceae bacterium]MDN5823791.1 alpha/beta hydrolase [Micrococcaceae bacterium]MDN5879216.1 alpha/beta hydrolase [Micrococcaceae bacterium]MDN5887032.1 alpha/beta hydrolase [Micrococcaceae bacterium]